MVNRFGNSPSEAAENSAPLTAGSENQAIGNSSLSVNLAELTDDEDELVLQHLEFLKPRRTKNSASETNYA